MNHCQNCKKRTSKCHIDCLDYKAFLKQNEELKQKKFQNNLMPLHHHKKHQFTNTKLFFNNEDD